NLTMKLSPHQVRTVLKVNEQTLRYWKRTYSALAGRRGYGPCYTFSEVLVLLVTKRLVEQLGVDVSKLEPIAVALFEACKSSVLLLSGADHTVYVDVACMAIVPGNSSEKSAGGVRIELSLPDLARELRARILDSLGDDEAAQMSLALGPTAIGSPPKQKQA
ncbi:MerR family transcriptional regulator, partial [Zoogloea oleivorans]|uniref:MerR family transcriptional regulator n=1 Tax=Zoogloea oleivorans TaxID=1552750 RepID=UPI001CA324CA